MALYAGGTSLLLHGNGADGSTVFTDETGKTVTAYGNARISTTQSKFGGSSAYFGGYGDYLTVPNSTTFDFGADDFTIEAWVYPLAAAANTVFAKWGVGAASFIMEVASNGRPYAAWNNGSVGAVTATTTTVPLGTWTHLAFVKVGTTLKFYVNGGADSTTATISGSLQTVNTPCTIGVINTTDGGWFNGYISDLHILKGTALYTANFTPPTAPLEVFLGYPIQIQAHDPGITKLAKYDPSQIKPVISEVTNDLQDRMPYGLWKTPAVLNEFQGRGRITGTVKNTPGTPVSRLVRLHREPDGMFVKAVWSDPITGAYEFNGVRPDCKYTVTSYDHTQAYRAVIADRVIPDALP